jgi:hypothetical protein
MTFPKSLLDYSTHVHATCANLKKGDFFGITSDTHRAAN